MNCRRQAISRRFPLRAKYRFSTKSGNIVSVEADTSHSCQDLICMAKREHSQEKIIEIYSEHVYPFNVPIRDDVLSPPGSYHETGSSASNDHS